VGPGAAVVASCLGCEMVSMDGIMTSRWSCCRLTNASENKRNAVPRAVWYYVAQVNDTANGKYSHEDVAGDIARVVWVEVKIRLTTFSWEDRSMVVH